MAKGYILVEGHGEVEAVPNLISRLCQDIDCLIPWTKPLRWTNLHQWEAKRGGIQRGANFIRTKPNAGALLILRDEDDACPKRLAPVIADQLRSLTLPFPVAYTLLRPEYEVLFLPCLQNMTGSFPDGRAGLNPTAQWDKDSWEGRRGIKEWLSTQFPQGQSYKPTVDQLTMTRKIDFQTLRQAKVPCFGTLERALRFLSTNFEQAGVVYP